VRDDHLTLEAFADYHTGAPPINRVVIQPIPEASTRIAALLAGEVDIVDQLPADAVNTVSQSGDSRVEQAASNSLAYVAMNTFEPPLDDVRVRQALNYAVDWDTILTFILNGYGVRAPFPATPYDFGYDEYAAELQQFTYSYDPERARQLLAEAGYPDGFTTTLETSEVATNQAVDVAQTIADQLAEVGVTVEIQTAAASVFLDRWRAAEITGLHLYEVANPLFDPDHLMSVQWDPERTSRYYNAPELTELIHAGMANTNEAERVEIYREIMAMLLQAAPWLFAYNVVDLYGVRNDIAWTPRADRRVFLFEASFVQV